MRVMLVAWLVALTPVSSDRTARADSVSSRLLALTGGKRVKLAWQQDQTSAGNNVFGDANVFKLLTYDTDDDTIRELASAQDDYTKPLISHDGSRVVFTDRVEKSIRVVPFAGGTPKAIASGFAGALWLDPDSGKEWVYFQEGSGGDNASAPIKRLDLDNPQQVELVWSATQTHALWLAISGDGTHLASCWPWSTCGVVVPNHDGSGGGAQHLSSGGVYQGGCWTTITPDATHRFAVFDGPHRNWIAYDWPPGNKRTIDISGAPGIDGWEVYHPKHSNLPEFMTMTGPYSNGAMGANNIAKGGPQVEVYLGQLDVAFTKVTDWVRVTDNDKGDFYPTAWIDPGPAASQVRIVKLEASPAVVPPGGTARLSYETDNATRVTLEPAAGEVAPSGTVEVTVAATTTYTLTAEGPGGPRTRQVTVTVSDEPPRLAWIRLSPASVTIKVGQTARLVAEPLDQFEQAIAAQVTWQASGGGAVTSEDGAGLAAAATFASSGEAGSFELRASAVAGDETVSETATIDVVAEAAISIVSPAGGERWPAGSTQLIRFETDLTDVAIEYSLDGGRTFENITPSVDTSSPDWGALPWQLPATTSETALVNLKGYFGEAPTNSSLFAIVAPGDPGGGTLDSPWLHGGCALCAARPGDNALAVALLALCGLMLRRSRARRRGQHPARPAAGAAEVARHRRAPPDEDHRVASESARLR